MPTTYAIPDGRTVMAATTYTGNGTTQSISNAVNGVSFQPDFAWFKNRSGANNHALYDSVRGRALGLISNATNAEQSASAGNDLVSFDSNGVSLGPVEDFTSVNGSAQSIVAWQWKAGGTAVTNTAGSITSSVSANTTAGFSVVTYTGTGANATVGHGLGVTPGMVIVKARSTTGDWCVTMPTLGANNVVFMNLANASASFPTVFNGLPTSTIFNIGTAGSTNTNAATYVAYCFAAVAGYSAFGKYTGNGSTDGPFTYLGFRPRFIMFKRTDSTGSWFMEDSSRGTYNVMGPELYAESSAAEATATRLDFLSNGFKMRAANAGDNANGGTYIYMAFAENPFKFSNAR